MSDLSVLLDDVSTFVRRFVVMTEAQLVAVVLWIAHTHSIDGADATPYLHVSSPARRTGKSRLLDVCALLVRWALSAGGASEAALFRSLAAEPPPTLLMDEVDTVFGPKAPDNEGIRGVLDNGYTRGKPYLRCVGEGSRQKVEPFAVFGPKMLCGIGGLPDTIADRSLPIRLKRKTRGETAERFRERQVRAEAAPLRERLSAWADENLDALAEARPALPDELDDRAQDVCEPLLAIADLAGGEWPQRARKALVALRAEQDEDDEAIGIRLLIDIREVAIGRTEITTASLLTALFKVESSPWADWWGETHRDKEGETSIVPSRGGAMRLARMLKPFGVRPGTIGGKAKGYRLADFTDAFERYLTPPEDAEPPSAPSEVVQVVQTAPQSQEPAEKSRPEQGSLDDLEQPVFGSTTPGGRPGRPESPEGEACDKNRRPLTGKEGFLSSLVEAHEAGLITDEERDQAWSAHLAVRRAEGEHVA